MAVNGGGRGLLVCLALWARKTMFLSAALLASLGALGYYAAWAEAVSALALLFHVKPIGRVLRAAGLVGDGRHSCAVVGCTAHVTERVNTRMSPTAVFLTRFRNDLADNPADRVFLRDIKDPRLCKRHAAALEEPLLNRELEGAKLKLRVKTREAYAGIVAIAEARKFKNVSKCGRASCEYLSRSVHRLVQTCHLPIFKSDDSTRAGAFKREIDEILLPSESTGGTASQEGVPVVLAISIVDHVPPYGRSASQEQELKRACALIDEQLATLASSRCSSTTLPLPVLSAKLEALKTYGTGFDAEDAAIAQIRAKEAEVQLEHVQAPQVPVVPSDEPAGDMQEVGIVENAAENVDGEGADGVQDSDDDEEPPSQDEQCILTEHLIIPNDEKLSAACNAQNRSPLERLSKDVMVEWCAQYIPGIGAYVRWEETALRRVIRNHLSATRGRPRLSNRTTADSIRCGDIKLGAYSRLSRDFVQSTVPVVDPEALADKLGRHRLHKAKRQCVRRDAQFVKAKAAVSTCGGYVAVSVTVRASMKSEWRNVVVWFRRGETGERAVCWTHNMCNCPAGQQNNCSHVARVLYFLQSVRDGKITEPYRERGTLESSWFFLYERYCENSYVAWLPCRELYRLKYLIAASSTFVDSAHAATFGLYGCAGRKIFPQCDTRHEKKRGASLL